MSSRANILECCGKAVPETRRPCEPDADAHLERRPRGRLADRFLEERDREIVEFEVREQEESLRAQAPRLHVGQRLSRQRPGACPFTRSLLGARGGQRAAMKRIAALRR